MPRTVHQAPGAPVFTTRSPALLRQPAGPGVAFAAALRARILEHVCSDPRREVCGLIGGVGGVPASSHPVRNCAANPARRFLMQPSDQLAALAAIAAVGQDLLGIYHSHVAAAATPSARDVREAAYTELLYLIAGPTRGPSEVELRGYLWRACRYWEVALIPRNSVSILEQTMLLMQHNC